MTPFTTRKVSEYDEIYKEKEGIVDWDTPDNLLKDHYISSLTEMMSLVQEAIEEKRADYPNASVMVFVSDLLSNLKERGLI